VSAATPTDAADTTATSPATGGTARAADGHDAYTLTVTLRVPDGDLLTGLAAAIAAVTADDALVVSAWTERGDGVYTAQATSTKPSVGDVWITADGVNLADLPALRYLGATAVPDRVAPGGKLEVGAAGFAPGEDVNGKLIAPDGTEVDTEQEIADDDGMVGFTVTLTTQFPLGQTRVEITGPQSGRVSAVFTVAADNAGGQTTPPEIGSFGADPMVQTCSLTAALMFVAGGSLLVASGRRRRTA
jgi:hypothetical protein